MATLVRVPEVAAGATEVVVSEWLVAEQAAVEAGQPLVTIETEKAVVEVPAETDAVLLKALVAPGASVAVGAPLAVIGAAGETGADVDALLAEGGVSRRTFITPLARRILADAGHTPENVTGTGPNGRILRRDVTKFLENTPTPEPEAEGIPHSRVRQAVAARLTASKQTIPHFYLKRTARLDALVALRQQLNAVAPRKISLNDLLILAVAAAYQQVPDANVVYTEQSLLTYTTVDVAVAIAGKRGLVTPVLRGVETLSPSAVAHQVKAYSADADAGRLRQRDLEGGVLTVSNLGMYGVEEFAAIINPPQSAILAVGAAAPRPTVVDGELTVTTTLPLVLSVDHRAIDGALAAQWMAALVEALEEPLRLLV